MKHNYIIGLDLGINNVGWAILDEDSQKIIKSGVRLFSPSDSAQERRISRNTRRRKKRQENRINEALKLFQSIGFPSENTIDQELLLKRKKGLKERLEKQEIVNIICYFMTHRGYIPFGDEERELVDLNGLYPCEYYHNLWSECGKYRALEQVVNHKDLKREFDQILNTQLKYYPELKKIIGSIKENQGIAWIFSRKRKFWEGPGSENSFSPYGRFQNESDVIEYKKRKQEGKEKYLFEELIGNCKICLKEKCTPKANYYAEEFNLINDFVNLKIVNIETLKSQRYVSEYKVHNESFYQLTTEGLDQIITYTTNTNASSLSYVKVLKEVLGISPKDIRGYRIDKKGTPQFSLFNAYRMIKKIYRENNVDFSWLLEDFPQNYNQFIQILTVTPGIVETQRMLEKIHTFSKEELEVIKQISEKLKKERYLEYHSLSEKALKRAIHDMKSTNLNFSTVSKKFDYGKEAHEYFVKNYGSGEGRFLMTVKYVNDIIASPQVKKTLRQAIRIINAIIKEQGSYPSVIAIESAKEMNGELKKKEIEKEQKKLEKYRTNAKQILENYTTEDKITKNMIERVMLFEELNGHCPYCNKPIDLNDVLNNTVEMEHILPLSQSSDDSFANKTLSCRSCNAKKKNRTPYEFMNEEQFEEFVKRVSSMNFSESKMKNLITTEDVNKHKIRFFHRNLRDTAYATKELINQVNLFHEYLKANLQDVEIKTLSTPGQLTHKIREDKWGLKKDRSIGKYHHAQDAAIVAAIATTPIGKLIIESQNDTQFWVLHKEQADRIPEYLENFSMYQWKDEISSIDNDEKIHISMQVNKDVNRKLSDANLYSFIKKGEEYYRIDQISDIYSPDLMEKYKNKLDILFNETNKNQILLCQEQDPKLFQYLKNIYVQYQEGKKNPFLNYCYEKEELEDPKRFDYRKHGIFTPSKNNKGALVKRLRFMQSTVNPWLLDKKNMNKKSTTFIGYGNVSIYCTRLFWDKDLQKIIFIPIYCPVVDFKTKQINEQHPIYRQYMDQYLKNKNVEFIVDLFNGNYVEIVKKSGERIKRNIASYNKTNKIVSCKPDNYLSSKDKFTLYDVDVLGNKKKRVNFGEDIRNRYSNSC